MSERITKIFQNTDSDSESEDELNEYSDIEYDFEDSDEEEVVYEDTDTDEEDVVNKNTKKDPKKKDSLNISQKNRESSCKLMVKIFGKHGIASQNREAKVKDIEKMIYTKSENNLIKYNELVRSIVCASNNLIFSQIKNLISSDYFESSLFEDAKKTDDKFLNNITCKLEPVSGIHKCKCGCDKVYSYELQTRSADEGMTVFLQCYECGKKWRY